MDAPREPVAGESIAERAVPNAPRADAYAEAKGACAHIGGVLQRLGRAEYSGKICAHFLSHLHQVTNHSGFHGGISPGNSACVELTRMLGSVRCIQTLLAVPKSACGKSQLRPLNCGPKGCRFERWLDIPTMRSHVARAMALPPRASLIEFREIDYLLCW